MSQFFDRIGPMAIATRLKFLSERLNKESADIFALYENDLKPKWYSAFYVLSHSDEALSISEIAKEIGQARPTVLNAINEMIKNDLVDETQDTLDPRKNTVALSIKGQEYAKRIKGQYIDTTHVVETMLDESDHNLWLALEEFERLLDETPTYPRIIKAKKERESNEVEIVPYDPSYKEAFKTLNKAWIDTYFDIEDEDEINLDNPKDSILNRGGFIFIALIDGEPVGTCALIKKTDRIYKYEIAKMAVDPKMQGRGVGWSLGKAALKKAKTLRVKKLFVEINTLLQPAINLYQKLGFIKIVGYSNPSKRSNIQMELEL